MNNVATNLWEWLTPIAPDERFALCITSIVVGLTAMVFVVGIVSHTIGKIHRTRLECALKRELLDRGMSAEEITEIVAATTGPKGLRLNLQGRGCAKEKLHAHAS